MSLTGWDGPVGLIDGVDLLVKEVIDGLRAHACEFHFIHPVMSKHEWHLCFTGC